MHKYYDPTSFHVMSDDELKRFLDHIKTNIYGTVKQLAPHDIFIDRFCISILIGSEIFKLIFLQLR